MIQSNSYNGVLFIDKPEGISSAQVLNLIKRRFSLYKKCKLGHAGTLDVLASGCLPVLLGSATKLAENILNYPKEYLFTIKLGYKTTTQDREGEIIQQHTTHKLTEEQINNCLHQFIGEIQQIPSKFSALKINGYKAYELARQGIEFCLLPRTIKIYAIQLLSYHAELQEITITATVSKGTYIRSLAEDIAAKLNTLGYVSYLRRTNIGDRSILKLTTLEDLNNIEEHIVHHEKVLDYLSNCT